MPQKQAASFGTKFRANLTSFNFSRNLSQSLSSWMTPLGSVNDYQKKKKKKSPLPWLKFYRSNSILSKCKNVFLTLLVNSRKSDSLESWSRENGNEVLMLYPHLANQENVASYFVRLSLDSANLFTSKLDQRVVIRRTSGATVGSLGKKVQNSCAGTCAFIWIWWTASESPSAAGHLCTSWVKWK